MGDNANRGSYTLSPARKGQFASRGSRDDWHPLAAARFDNDRMTQQQLADAAKVGRTTVARIERGAEPLVNTAVRLAAAVKCRVEDIWRGDR
jgi:DNA-binding XRE family transcriptional regulator